MKKPVSAVSWGEVCVGIGAVVLVFGFIGYLFLSMHQSAKPAGLNGVIEEKVFHPLAEQLVTFGHGGLKSRKSNGEYILKVRVDSQNRSYDVWVDETAYRSHKVGDTYFFIRPPVENSSPKPTATASPS